MPTDNAELVALCFDCGWYGKPEELAREPVEKWKDGTTVSAAYCPRCNSGCGVKVEKVEVLQDTN